MYKKIFNSEILFVGYYGHYNTGDDAFIEVASWGAEKYWDKKSNIFLAKHNNLPLVKKPVRGYPLNIPRTYRFQNRALVASTEYVISAGGSTINSELEKKNIKLLALKEKRKNLKLKIGAVGVSIGPFKTLRDEKATIEYLKEIDFISVRDQLSFDFLESLQLPYKPINAFDLAALLPDVYGLNQVEYLGSERKVVGVSVCPFESIVDRSKVENEGRRNSMVVELLKILDKNANIHFKFLVINGHPIVGDMKLTIETLNKVSPSSYEIVEYSRKTRAMWNQVASCDFIIATRLHAAIFACFSKTPFVLNEYHRKCGDFLDNIGYDENLRLFNSQYDPTEKAKLILEILSDKNKYINPKKYQDMKDRSKLNFTGVSL